MTKHALKWITLVGCLTILAWPTATSSANVKKGVPGRSPGVLSRPAAGNPVLRWNAIAIKVFAVEPGLVLDSRALAIMQKHPFAIGGTQ